MISCDEILEDLLRGLSFSPVVFAEQALPHVAWRDAPQLASFQTFYQSLPSAAPAREIWDLRLKRISTHITKPCIVMFPICFLVYAGSGSRVLPPNGIHMTRVAHGTHCVCEKVSESFENVNALVPEVEKIIFSSILSPTTFQTNRT